MFIFFSNFQTTFQQQSEQNVTPVLTSHVQTGLPAYQCQREIINASAHPDTTVGVVIQSTPSLPESSD